MDVEFHYYLTYVIARFAGLDDGFSYKIAYSSQYVDDNLYEQRIFCPYSLKEYMGVASSTYSPFITDNTLKILLSHHFLPGDYNDPMVVSADSKTSQNLLAQAVKTGNPYIIGIALHAYADTWAHQNFKGINNSYNDSGNLGGAFIPSIGHADFGVIPDAIGVCWHDRRFDIPINNNKRFIQAGLRMFDHLAQITTGKSTTTEKRLNLSNTLAMLMRKASRYSFIGHEIKQRQRTEGYISYIRRKFDVNLDYYDHKQWFQKAVAKERLSLFWKPGADTSDWYQFQLAVRQWQRLVSQHEVFHQALTLEF